jgi:putative nucleotidyltransferase with HDIG domain
VNSISLQQVTENVQYLPSLPSIVMELLNDIDNDDVDLNLLVQKVSSDLALTATTLRYANSAHYATMIKVTTIQQAINLMGLVSVKKIIMMAALSGCFPENNCKGFDHKAFWEHSIAVAIAAKLIAKRVNLNVDMAYTAGLLHDLGALVLVTQYPRQYETTINYRHEHQLSQFEAERKVLGIDHAEVGLALAKQWNFSDLMKNAIAGHHRPEMAGLGLLATVIHVADGIAHAIGATSTPDTHVIEVSGQSCESLNLHEAAIQELMHETEAELAKIHGANLG